ncbi:MAG: tRNA pseudouridine(38-40) synthase TruA [Propionibacteriaceae bacterium]|nr:tRNA pseudouridine(38-40) synthase TruA [Propionibacteriaceae bacterium]
MKRWRLDIAYDGGGFTGWAAQPGLRTVQGELERWIQQLLRLPDPVTLVCAGRTDAGVHARGQVAHLDLPPETIADDGTDLFRRLAAVLPGDVVVRSLDPAPADFDARFGAVWRRYVYRISDLTTPPDPLSRHQIARVRHRIDVAAMNRAGSSLLGLRDFAPFCRRRDGATTVRTLLELAGARVECGPLAGTIDVTVRADAFCHSMVRSLVGAVTAVGTGQRGLDWLASIADGTARDPSVQVMPAAGLCLEEVRYPPDDQLAARARESRSVREVPDG